MKEMTAFFSNSKGGAAMGDESGVNGSGNGHGNRHDVVGIDFDRCSLPYYVYRYNQSATIGFSE